MTTLGEQRVRATFNPGGHELVNEIKSLTANLIDLCNKHQDGLDTETTRCWALAMTCYEDAAMWAVKAATAGK